MTMQSRRDLFQAHRLMTQRASLALLRGEPDVPDQPMRRMNVATFAGLLVAVIATALFAIWGVLGHNTTSLQSQGGTLILDQNGDPYVFCFKTTEICPVANYASARLELKSDSLNQQTVSQGTLANYTRGPEIGILGLPPLPGSSLMVTQPWSVCTQTPLTASGLQTTTTLAVGTSTGGSPLDNGALLVAAQGQDWVVWDAQRMAIASANLHALSSSQSSAGLTPVKVPAQWLGALPQGPAFAPPSIPNQGQTVTGPAGSPATVGQVFSVPAAGQFYVMLSDGLATITQTQSRLLEFEPGAPTPGTLTPSEVTAHTSKITISSGGLPATVPALAAASSTAPLCVVYTAAGGSRTLSPAVYLGGQVPAGAVTNNPADVSQVAVPAEKGALVGDETGSNTISYFLVTSGRRYALSETEVAGFLGYNLSQAVLLPAGVVDLIPAGPALDPAQAAKPVASG